MSHSPGFRVSEMFAYLAVGDDGEEGVPAVNLHGLTMPLIAADQVRLKELRPYADQVAQELGRPVLLVRFSVREVVETIPPA